MWEWARLLGAAQEADRLGHDQVDARHLLLTVLAEPGVRRLFADAGVDLRDVQAQVGAIAPAGERVLVPGSGRTPSAREVSPSARRVLEEVVAVVEADAELAEQIGPGRGRTPRATARVQRLLAVRLLVDDAPDGVAGLVGHLGARPGRHHLADRIAALDPGDVDAPVGRTGRAGRPDGSAEPDVG